MSRTTPTVRARLSALASGLLAAAITAATPSAAADLGGDFEPRYGSPYDDPRYADIYRHPAPRSHAEHDDPPPRTIYRDREYLPPMRGGPRRYSRTAPDDCVPRHVARQRLSDEGWEDFHDLELAGPTAYVRARRRSGRLFELTIDRCSGEVVSARPYGPHAFRSRSFRDRS